eukprot:1141996-Pelagomonas_calceolata.AAC.2
MDTVNNDLRELVEWQGCISQVVQNSCVTARRRCTGSSQPGGAAQLHHSQSQQASATRETEDKVANSVADFSTQFYEVTSALINTLEQQHSGIDAGTQEHAALVQEVEHIAIDVSRDCIT